MIKVENYLVLFTLISSIIFLLRTDKALVNSLKCDFLDYFHNNNWWWIATIFTSILSYGFTLTHYSLGVDDEALSSYISGGLLSLGRFGASHFFQLIFDAYEFLPFWFDCLGVAMIIIASIVWSIFFIRMSHGKLNKNYTIVFSCLVISYPVTAYLFVFMGNAYSIGIALILTATALLLFSSWLCGEPYHRNLINSHPFYKVIAASLILAISLGMHEWSAVMFLTGIFSGLMFAYVSHDKKITFGTLMANFAKIVIFLSISIIFNKLITIVYQKINHIDNLGYTSNFILWHSGQLLEQLQTFISNIYMVFFKNFIKGGPVSLWLNIFIYSMIIDLLIAAFYSIKNKSFIPVFIVFFIIGSAFSLIIVTGNPWLELRTYVYLVIPVASSFMLFIFITFSINPSIKQPIKSHFLVLIQKGIKVVALSIVILVVLYQTKDISRLFYFEYLRYEADVRTANNIITEIEKQVGSLKKPVVFIGPFTGSANIQMGYVIFTHDRWNIPEKMLSPGRIIGFMRQLGYEMEAVSSQDDLNKAKDASQSMPSYPKEGSILAFDNFVIVKFGELIT